jgi:hypothetical protein
MFLRSSILGFKPSDAKAFFVSNKSLVETVVFK